MKRRSALPGRYGWIVVVGSVAAIDLTARDGETLSEALHRARRHHPVLVSSVVLAVAEHLLVGGGRFDRFDCFRLRFRVYELVKGFNPTGKECGE